VASVRSTQLGHRYVLPACVHHLTLTSDQGGGGGVTPLESMLWRPSRWDLGGVGQAARRFRRGGAEMTDGALVVVAGPKRVIEEM